MALAMGKELANLVCVWSFCVMVSKIILTDKCPSKRLNVCIYNHFGEVMFQYKGQL